MTRPTWASALDPLILGGGQLATGSAARRRIETGTQDTAAREEPRAPGRFLANKGRGGGEEGTGQAKGCGESRCSRRQQRHRRRGAGWAGAGVLTAVSSRYTSGYWKDSMAGANRERRGARAAGADASALAWLQGEAGARAGAGRAAAGRGLSARARATRPAAPQRRRGGSRKQLSARPGAPPRRAGPAAAVAARGSGRRRA